MSGVGADARASSAADDASRRTWRALVAGGAGDPGHRAAPRRRCPAGYRVRPEWVVPVVLVTLLAALIIGDPGRIDRQRPWLRIVTGAVITALVVARAINILK